MAATYPQQLLDAADWLQDPQHAALQGDELAQALEPLPWDPSVKALVAFPQIIAMMTEHLEWTEALGLAFATQQAQVMQRVQALRQLAVKSGRIQNVKHVTVETGRGPRSGSCRRNPTGCSSRCTTRPLSTDSGRIAIIRRSMSRRRGVSAGDARSLSSRRSSPALRSTAIRSWRLCGAGRGRTGAATRSRSRPRSTPASRATCGRRPIIGGGTTALS